MPEAALRAETPATDPVATSPAAGQLHAVDDVEARFGAAIPPAPRLELARYDLAAALTLERELGISHVLSQILVRRGWDEVRPAREFLAAEERHDPGAFAGIDRAVGLIRGHVAAGRRIVVHGDYDVDGVCATAIVVGALRRLGANVGWFLPSRLADGYGVSRETIRRLRQLGTDLLITVDCGITAVEEVREARRQSLDVLITDHHAPRADGELPDCPTVHPLVCGYPFEHLCGTSVAFKLAQALGSVAADDLELVALATVADLVPLQGENRSLVREGLNVLANTARPGLRALLASSRSDPSGLDAHVLGFRLAPRINAAGRVGRPDSGLELLLTDDPERAAEIAGELEALNAERRAIEERIWWEAEAGVARFGSRSAFVLAGTDWHPGVIGIVASRIVERYHRPAILIALDEEMGTGSGRSIAGFDLLSALQVAAPHMERYGGHRAAAGLTIRSDQVGALRAAIERHADEVLQPELRTPVEHVDAVVSGAELGLPLAEELAALEPCGMGNPSPRLLVPGARFGDLRPMGKGRHARFSVSSGGARSRAVAFGCDGRPGGDSGGPLDATFRLERSTWNGAVEPRLVLRHAQPCAPAQIEILGEPVDYLAAVWAELEAEGGETVNTAAATDRGEILNAAGGPQRIVLDRRGESPLAVLADAMASGPDDRDSPARVPDGRTLAVCADVARRIEGVRARVGGFSLIGYHALERDPAQADKFAQLVLLDPPGGASAAALIRAGVGYSHLAWGRAELRFAEQIHELEYGLRTSLVALYRGLRLRGRVVGEELERLLRGDGPHPRPARLAGRLIKVLAELELVSLNRDLPALEVANERQTALDRSSAYRVYEQRYEDGRRFLSSANLLPDG